MEQNLKPMYNSMPDDLHVKLQTLLRQFGVSLVPAQESDALQQETNKTERESYCFPNCIFQ